MELDYFEPSLFIFDTYLLLAKISKKFGKYVRLTVCLSVCLSVCYLPKFSILASMFVWRFVTCQNFEEICKYVRLSVCYLPKFSILASMFVWRFVCLFVCLFVCNVNGTGRTVQAINTKLGTCMYLGSGYGCIVFGVHDVIDDVIRSKNRSNF